MNTYINKGVLFLYGAFIIEFIVFFFYRQQLGYIIAPLLFTVSGLFIALFPFFSKLDFTNTARTSFTINKVYIYVFFALVFILFGFWAQHIFTTNPIDIKKSDILPIIDSLYVVNIYIMKLLDLAMATIGLLTTCPCTGCLL